MKDNIEIRPGKNRYFTLITLVVFFQLVFYFIVGLSFYAIFTLNWKIIIVLSSISILQCFTPKSQAFIYYIKKFVHPLWYFKSYTRIYDEHIEP